MDAELTYLSKKIKAVVFDVDGVMTDGSLTFREDGLEIKTYNAKDGQGINMLNVSGFTTAIITARDNPTVSLRFNMLGMSKLYMGQKNKISALEDLVKTYNIGFDEIAYMGDDIPDICVLTKVGLPCCPNDAVDEVKAVSKFISSKNGGKGAVRELCDFLLKSQSK